MRLSSRKILLGSLLVVLGTVLSTQGPARAQPNVPQEKIKEEFFSQLERPEIVQLMKSIDRGKQLTSFELGAKYRWGYIPPDRRPPLRLAQWWQGLSARQRDQERFEWFQKHYQQLDLSRAARELNLQDALTQIYRQLQRELNQPAGNLESVPFPGEAVNRSGESGSDTGFQPIYQQSPSGSDQTVSASTSAPSGDNESSSGSISESEDAVNPSKKSSPETNATETDRSRDQTVTSTRSDTRSFQDESVIYRRIGDDIEIVGGGTSGPRTTDRADTGAETKKSSENSADSPTTSPSPGKPKLNRSNPSGSSSSFMIPFPELRHLMADPPRLRR